MCSRASHHTARGFADSPAGAVAGVAARLPMHPCRLSCLNRSVPQDLPSAPCCGCACASARWRPGGSAAWPRPRRAGSTLRGKMQKAVRWLQHGSVHCHYCSHPPRPLTQRLLCVIAGPHAARTCAAQRRRVLLRPQARGPGRHALVGGKYGRRRLHGATFPEDCLRERGACSSRAAGAWPPKPAT